MLEPRLAQMISLNTARSIHSLGLIVERDSNKQVHANVAHIEHHSPTGFECGYAGSGPADLALSALAEMMPVSFSPQDEQDQYGLPDEDFNAIASDPTRWSVAVASGRVRVLRFVHDHYHAFMHEFIAPMPYEGGHVSVEAILAWINQQMIRSSLTSA